MRLLDLFCGAGGAARGYHDAGFEVVGVDHVPQKNYPYEFVQADITDEDFAYDFDFMDFDVIHASPPCQVYSRINRGEGHPDLLEWTQEFMDGLTDGDGLPMHQYIIENVPGAPMPSAVQLCGSAFGGLVVTAEGTFELRRHRWFQTSFAMLAPPCAHQYPALGVYGDLSKNMRLNNAVRGRSDRKAGIADAAALMGIDWMTGSELSQAIPPAYTRYIGERALEALGAAVRA